MNKTLKSFIDYCVAHPQERFWQALRNWSGFSFIYGCHVNQNLEKNFIDTYYIEDEK